MIACHKGYFNIVRLLLTRNDIDVHLQEENGRNVLMIARARGYIKIVELLLQNGANVNEKNKYGWTALMFACERGSPDIVELLLDNRK